MNVFLTKMKTRLEMNLRFPILGPSMRENSKRLRELLNKATYDQAKNTEGLQLRLQGTVLLIVDRVERKHL